MGWESATPPSRSHRAVSGSVAPSLGTCTLQKHNSSPEPPAQRPIDGGQGCRSGAEARVGTGQAMALGWTETPAYLLATGPPGATRAVSATGWASWPA